MSNWGKTGNLLNNIFHQDKIRSSVVLLAIQQNTFNKRFCGFYLSWQIVKVWFSCIAIHKWPRTILVVWIGLDQSSFICSEGLLSPSCIDTDNEAWVHHEWITISENRVKYVIIVLFQIAFVQVVLTKDCFFPYSRLYDVQNIEKIRFRGDSKQNVSNVLHGWIHNKFGVFTDTSASEPCCLVAKRSNSLLPGKYIETLIIMLE